MIDLSRTGACLRFEATPVAPIVVGRPVCLALDDSVGGRAVAGRWLGRVAHLRDLGQGGLRMGLAFDGGRGLCPPFELAELTAPSPSVGDCDPAAGSAAVALAAAGLLLDQASKAWAWSLPAAAAASELLPGLLSVNLLENHGALGSLGVGHPFTATLCALSSLTLAAVAPRWAAGDRASAWATGLLAAGLLGNAGDRLALGYVRDFLSSPQFPELAFNLADVFLLLGAVTLVARRGRGTPQGGAAGAEPPWANG